MVKKRILQDSWYCVRVAYARNPNGVFFRWHVLAVDIELAKRKALSEVGAGYVVLDAQYKGTKSMYSGKFKTTGGFARPERELPYA